jgi:hypothetical protein
MHHPVDCPSLSLSSVVSLLNKMLIALFFILMTRDPLVYSEVEDQLALEFLDIIGFDVLNIGYFGRYLCRIFQPIV